VCPCCDSVQDRVAAWIASTPAVGPMSHQATGLPPAPGQAHLLAGESRPLQKEAGGRRRRASDAASSGSPESEGGPGDGDEGEEEKDQYQVRWRQRDPVAASAACTRCAAEV
jgi:hypothetical protein